MTGPISDPSGWTFQTLLYHIKEILDLQDKRYSERQEAAKESITSALIAASTAVNKAEVGADKRFESVNEFRKLVNDVLADQKETMMPRKEVLLLFDGLKAQNIELARQVTDYAKQVSGFVSQGAGEKSGKTETWKDVTLVISVILAILAVVSRFIK